METVLKPADYLHQQISEVLRGRILEGRIPVGTRLLIKDLARDWQTSAFTIQRALNPLSREGLLQSRRRTGTIVVRRTPQIACMGIYYGTDIWSIPEADLYRTIHAQLTERLTQREIKFHVITDQRPEAQHNRPHAAIQRMIADRDIQGLIAPIANLPQFNWLAGLPIIKSYLGTGDAPWRVRGHDKENLRLALTALRERGVRGVSLIQGTPMEKFMQHPFTLVYSHFLDLLKEFGMHTRNHWCDLPDHLLKASEMEAYGYHALLRVWESRPEDRPEGLICGSDIVGRGVVAAILEKQITVPTTLKLVQFKNQRSSFFTPLETDWVVYDETQYANALLRQIHRQTQGESVEEILIEGRLEISAHQSSLSCQPKTIAET